VSTAGVATSDRVLGVTIQRSDGDKPGPIVFHLLAPNQVSGSGTVVMRGRNREDLVGGKLYLHFYTRQTRLGSYRSKIGV
jgi:amidase